MKWCWSLLIFAILAIHLGNVFTSSVFRKQFIRRTLPVLPSDADPGQPLFLTPYIEKGQIDQAQQLAKVGPLNGTSVVSYAGFLTVNKTYNSNLYFWFFPSVTQKPKDPILLWLQGGPGGSSLFGLFVENGPFYVDKNLHLNPRKFSWNTKYNVLYIDNPVGTGFSFTDNDMGYAKTQDDVADNLYNALGQFFQLFPHLRGNFLYLTGESYAGKYIPVLASKLLHQPKPRQIYLRGVAIGDGFSDPPVMIQGYADFMYQVGLLDERQREVFRNATNQASQFIKDKKWIEADELFDTLLNADLSKYPSYFTNCTGSVDYYNYMRTKSPEEFEYYSNFVVRADVRQSIHVGNLPYQSGDNVEKFLLADIMQSVKPQLTEIMNYTKVLLYSGQLDVIVALPLTEQMIETISWKYAADYQRGKRIVWKVRPDDVEVAGYVRRAHDFYQVAIRGSGHIAPYDQPERVWDMIDRFITEQPFTN
jgi:vitellogenic carboxypeptidase-like protein